MSRSTRNAVLLAGVATAAVIAYVILSRRQQQQGVYSAAYFNPNIDYASDALSLGSSVAAFAAAAAA